jgi:hypothetical protein
LQSSRPSTTVVVLLILSFTLVFWLLVLWLLPGRSLIEIYRLWSTPGYAGFSLFSASTFIVLLLLYLLIVEALLSRHSGDNLAVAFCLLSALPVAAVGAFLAELSHPPVYYLLERFDRIDEPFDVRAEPLGRVLATRDVGTTRYLQVALEDGTRVTVSAVPRYESPSDSEYVVVRRFSGRHTHTLCHQLSSYLPADSLDLSTQRELDELK